MDDKPPPKSKSLKNDDAALWQAMTKDVERLEGKEYQEVRDISEPKVKETGRETAMPEKITIRKGSPKGKELDKRTDERLRRGQMEIEATLDMHNMTQDKAEQALNNFILSSHRQGKRCVLVVTGKGKSKLKTDDEDWLAPKPGALKRMTPEWLSRGALKDIVLKTYPARNHHGGDGALYVFLRRER